MSKRYWLVGAAAAVVVIVILLVVSLPGTQGHTATVSEIVRQVDAQPRSRDAWQAATLDMAIYGGGQVRTGAASSARLQLLEGTVRLSAETVFTLKKSATHQDRLVTALSLQQGRLWAHLTTDRPHEFAIETGTAVAAVRDTRFSVRVDGGETLLSVAEGTAVLTAQGQSVTVSAGQQAIARSGQHPSPPEPLSDEERALWATEGERPDLAPATPTPAPQVHVNANVFCRLTGPAGAPGTRSPETVFDVYVQGKGVAQMAVTLPDGRRLALQPYGDIYGQQPRFMGNSGGMPQAGGTYTFVALDAGGRPIPDTTASDVYVGGYELDPPTNVRAKVTAAGVLVTWDPSPVIPGGFDPGGTPPLGYYQMDLSAEGRGMEYGWHHAGMPLAETAHLIPLQREDFGPTDIGLALKELEDGVYTLRISAFSVAPEGTAGQNHECAASDPAQELRVILTQGRIRIEKPGAARK
jgi:hypothetical protein